MDRRAHPTCAIHVPFGLRIIERCEKRKTLDMVPMGVRDQQVASASFCAPRKQVLPEGLGAGTAIENDKRSLVRREFDAGRVAAISDCRGPWLRN